MGEAGAGEMQMRSVGMVDRRDQPALAVGGVEVDGLAETLALDQRGQAAAAAGGFQGKRVDAFRAVHDPRGAVGARDHLDHVRPVDDL